MSFKRIGGAGSVRDFAPPIKFIRVPLEKLSKIWYNILHTVKEVLIVKK